MFPPLPPPMPPWPGGKPPWERDAAASAPPQQQAQPAPPPQQRPQLPPPRPQVVHGLLPPQMTLPTYSYWFTPQAYPAQGQQQARPAVQPPPPQQQPAPQQPMSQQQVQQTPAGPVRVERLEDQSKGPQPFHPVIPVSAPGVPLGARHRHYWNRT